MSYTGTLAFALWATALGACATTTAPPAGPANGPPAPAPPPASSPVPPGPEGVASTPSAPRACHLPAPRKSDDTCKVDADCGPSDPCHAKACVAKAKSKPRTPEVMCTMMMGCDTADANRCGCFEGRCALIPPEDTEKP